MFAAIDFGNGRGVDDQIGQGLPQQFAHLVRPDDIHLGMAPTDDLVVAECTDERLSDQAAAAGNQYPHVSP